jgi:16S rRNA (guanine1207-N2)-methyltransferase
VEQPFDLDGYSIIWSTRYAERTIQLYSLPGVFAHGHLDPGTALLLQALAPLQPTGRMLDFACGCGVIGLALLAASASTSLTLLDSSAVAIESARRSLDLNGMQARLLPSDGLAELAKCPRPRYDWIVSNPPFHRGVAHDLEVAEAFFRQAGTFLAENGKMVVVFNRHLPYSRWLQNAFDCVESLVDREDFRVVQLSGPTATGTSATTRAGLATKHRGNRQST